tara:strand:+ start:2611 stop:2721 length:111 start_codon:yes stop_codon:yes gene_type:complete
MNNKDSIEIYKKKRNTKPRRIHRNTGGRLKGTLKKR